jgi:hypothetical protein
MHEFGKFTDLRRLKVTQCARFLTGLILGITIFQAGGFYGHTRTDDIFYWYYRKLSFCGLSFGAGHNDVSFFYDEDSMEFSRVVGLSIAGYFAAGSVCSFFLLLVYVRVHEQKEMLRSKVFPLMQ